MKIKLNGIVLFVLFSISINVLGQNSSTEQRSYDLFDSYVDGSLSGNGTSNENGWSSGWESGGNSWSVVDGNIDGSEGKHVAMVENTGANICFRSMEQHYSNTNGVTYWLGFKYAYNANDKYAWNGVSLFNDNDELIFIGHLSGSEFLGVDFTGGNSGTSDNAYDQAAWFVCRIDMFGEGQNPHFYLWFNPITGVEPDINNADISSVWSKGINGFNRIRLGGDSNFGSMMVDDLAIGTDFTQLYDFSQGTSTGVTSLNAKEFSILQGEGNITITDVLNKQVCIYTVSGEKVYANKPLINNIQVSMKKGIYIVTVNNQSQKVFIK